MRVKTTKLFQHRRRSDQKLWKRKPVFLRLQRRGYKIILKNCSMPLITIKPKLMEPKRAFSATGLLVAKIRNRLNDGSVLWLSGVSIINIIQKLCNSLIICAVWQFPSKEEQHTFRTTPREHWWIWPECPS